MVLSSDDEAFGGYRNVCKDNDVSFHSHEGGHDNRPNWIQVGEGSREGGARKGEGGRPPQLDPNIGRRGVWEGRRDADEACYLAPRPPCPLTVSVLSLSLSRTYARTDY